MSLINKILPSLSLVAGIGCANGPEDYRTKPLETTLLTEVGQIRRDLLHHCELLRHPDHIKELEAQLDYRRNTAAQLKAELETAKGLVADLDRVTTLDEYNALKKIGAQSSTDMCKSTARKVTYSHADTVKNLAELKDESDGKDLRTTDEEYAALKNSGLIEGQIDCNDTYPSIVNISTFAELARLIENADAKAQRTVSNLQPYLAIRDEDHEAALQTGFGNLEELLQSNGWQVTLDRACTPGETFKTPHLRRGFSTWGISILVERSK